MDYLYSLYDALISINVPTVLVLGLSILFAALKFT